MFESCPALNWKLSQQQGPFPREVWPEEKLTGRPNGRPTKRRWAKILQREATVTSKGSTSVIEIVLAAASGIFEHDLFAVFSIPSLMWLRQT